MKTSGKPVAKLAPLDLPEADPIFGFYNGKLDIVGDLMSPAYSDEEYKEFYERSAAPLRVWDTH